MTDLLQRTIDALRAENDTLAALVPTLTDAQLTGRSGADDWTVAQVLSHLGSGAEIFSQPLSRAAGRPVEPVENATIWARWDSSSPAEQASGFLTQNADLLAMVEGMTDEQRTALIDMGFLPEPVPLVVALGMRLNEVANHSWDVRVAVDHHAGILDDSATTLLDLLAGPISFMLGFAAKPVELSEPATVALPGFDLQIGEAATLVPSGSGAGSGSEVTATFDGPAEAAVRLLNGRLKEPYLAGATVTGNVTLGDLRSVFPGF